MEWRSLSARRLVRLLFRCCALVNLSLAGGCALHWLPILVRSYMHLLPLVMLRIGRIGVRPSASASRSAFLSAVSYSRFLHLVVALSGRGWREFLVLQR